MAKRRSIKQSECGLMKISYRVVLLRNGHLRFEFEADREGVMISSPVTLKVAGCKPITLKAHKDEGISQTVTYKRGLKKRAA